MFIHKLLVRAAATEAPDEATGAEAVQEGDTLIGDLPQELRQLHTTLGELAGAWKAFIQKLPPREELVRMDQRTLSEIALRERALHTEYELAREVFRQEVRLAFPHILTSDDEVTAIRQGWKVVTRAQPEDEGFAIDIAILGAVSWPRSN